MKQKKIASALAALMLLAAAGCSSAESPGSTAEESSSSEAASSSAADVIPAADTSSENDENTKLIQELSAKVDELTDKVKKLEERAATAFPTDGHEIYDDTAVIEAYKKSDGSSLADSKDKYIFEQLTQAVSEIIKDGMSDYEKEKAVYDYIFRNTHFNYRNLNPIDDLEEDWSHTPYGFFRDHSTICVGYATTFKLFMDALGIECQVIHSTKEGEHAWNIVKINGDWYHVDVFYDGGEQVPIYGNFNVNDEIKKLSGYPWNYDPDEPQFPECTSLKENYIVNNAKKCDDIYKLPEMIKKAIKKNNGVLFVRFPLPEGVTPKVYAMQISSILESVSSETLVFSSSVIPDTETGDACCGISIGELQENDEPYYPDDSGEELQTADIDYDRLRYNFYEQFNDELVLYDVDENFYYSSFDGTFEK